MNLSNIREIYMGEFGGIIEMTQLYYSLKIKEKQCPTNRPYEKLVYSFLKHINL